MLSYTDGTTKTDTADGNGDYTIWVSYDWSGTITPSKQGYSFSPPYRDYVDVDVYQSGQYYTATKVVSGIESLSTGAPTNYALYQNYPNPFNPTTMIRFGIPKASNVSITVYNILGQKVADLFKGYKEAGNYQVSFDASKLTSGMYIYRIEAGNYTQIKKMLLLK